MSFVLHLSLETPEFCVNYLLIYLLTPWNRILLEKLTGSQPVKKFPTFYGTWSFIIAFTRARHLSLSRANSIQSIPAHPTSWRFIFMLSHLRLGLPSGLFPSGFPTKTMYTPVVSPILATFPAHFILDLNVMLIKVLLITWQNKILTDLLNGQWAGSLSFVSSWGVRSRNKSLFSVLSPPDCLQDAPTFLISRCRSLCLELKR